MFVGRGTSGGQILGVAAIAVGILLVRGVGAAAAAAHTRGFILALVTAVFIAGYTLVDAGYTLVDKEGLKHAAPIPYIELVLVGPALIYLLAIWRVRGLPALQAETTFRISTIGVILFGTYILVLLALRIAPAASVSAIRETSVVIASAVAALVGHERVGPVRFAGAALVATGVALLALTG